MLNKTIKKNWVFYFYFFVLNSFEHGIYLLFKTFGTTIPLTLHPQKPSGLAVLLNLVQIFEKKSL